MTYLVTVIPLERGVWTDKLSYFSSKTITVGSLVTVPLRKKMIPALVTEVRETAQEKASIKSSKIALKKISQIVQENIFSKEMLDVAKETSDFFATGMGNVIASLFPVSLLKKSVDSAATPLNKITVRKTKKILLLQCEDEDRFSRYRSLSRESFRHKESVLCVVPTIQDAEKTWEQLSRGIEKYSIKFHSDLKERELIDAIRILNQENHPLLIVTTPGFLGLTLERSGTIIIERENSPAYKQLVKPFLDFRFLIRKFAESKKLHLVFGDLLLSLETVNRFKDETYEELATPRWRTNTKIETQIIDMREYKPNLRGTTQAISNELSSLIAKTRASHERSFVFSSRKGLAPTTICGDCGSLFLCKHCNHPVVLHKTSGQGRFYLCHRCGNKIGTEVRCKNCTSWKLTTLGIGTELIEHELNNLYPDLTVLRVDRESVKNRAQALRLVKKFYDTPGSVLVGTELAIPYLVKPVSTVAVASVDELFSIPDFRINERVAYLLYKLKSNAEHAFLLQTRVKENQTMQTIIKGDLNTLLKEELAIRKVLSYPPFSIPIKITWFGKPQTLKTLMQELAKELLPYTLDIFPVFEKYPKGKIGLSGIVKIPSSEWPKKETLEILRSFSPSVEITVDPVSFV